MGRFYAEKGWVVVSGLAQGCDTEAHRGCIEAGGKTVAVLAHGLDMVYPPENESLAKDIIESGGCLVTEYRPHDMPEEEHFIARNQIQEALCKAVIVVESDFEGSTMHTAQYATQLRRKLGCMSYLPDKTGTEDAKMEGNDSLVKAGQAK